MGSHFHNWIDYNKAEFFYNLKLDLSRLRKQSWTNHGIQRPGKLDGRLQGYNKNPNCQEEISWLFNKRGRGFKNSGQPRTNLASGQNGTRRCRITNLKR